MYLQLEATLKSLAKDHEQRSGGFCGVPISNFVAFVSSTSSQELRELQTQVATATTEASPQPPRHRHPYPQGRPLGPCHITPMDASRFYQEVP
jgi:hypothetical protein